MSNVMINADKNAFIKKVYVFLSIYLSACILSLLRSISLVEPQGTNLHPIQTFYLRLTEAECSIPVVTEKVQEQMDSEETIIICDSKGVEIMESAGTTGNFRSVLS